MAACEQGDRVSKFAESICDRGALHCVSVTSASICTVNKAAVGLTVPGPIPAITAILDADISWIGLSKL